MESRRPLLADVVEEEVELNDGGTGMYQSEPDAGALFVVRDTSQLPQLPCVRECVFPCS